MSNLLENIVYGLPEKYKKRIDEEDCYFSDGYCPSLDIISDYIEELEQFKKAVSPFLRRLKEPRYDENETNDYVCGSSECKKAVEALDT
jgi:hypothetical protein